MGPILFLSEERVTLFSRIQKILGKQARYTKKRSINDKYKAVVLTEKKKVICLFLFK